MFIGIGFGLFWPMFGYGGAAPAYTPKLDFSDSRNSQYVGVF